MFKHAVFANNFKKFCGKHLISFDFYHNKNSSYVLVHGFSEASKPLVVRFSDHENTSWMFDKPAFNVLSNEDFRDVKKYFKNLLKA